MALVFEARRESLAGVAPRVAIKLILPEHADSDTFQELFINEARLGASMHHQNLVQIQDFDRDGDKFFLVMEYVEGLTLRQVVSLCVRHDVEIPMGVVAEIGRQACDGLHYAHQATDERGVHLALVHRDVKPSNVMLNPHGVAKILDFGISKGNLLDEHSGAVRGTWGYMAPEQAYGREVGPNADVFGLATILYEMASRKPLFRKKKPDEIKRLLEDDHAARMAATLPPEYGPLVGVLVRALQRDPVARYATAADLGRALSALLPDPITARDSVVRFYKAVEGLEQGRQPSPVAHVESGKERLILPGPGAMSGPSQASIVAEPDTGSGRSGAFPWGWLITGAAVSVVLALAGVGLGVYWAGAGEADDGRIRVLDMDALGDLGELDPAPRASGQDAPPSDVEVPAEGLDVRPPPDSVPDPGPSRPPPTDTVAAPMELAPSAPSEGEQASDGEPEPVEVTAPEPVEEPVVVRIDRRAPEVRIVEVEPAGEGDGTAEATPADPPEAAEPVAVGHGWITLAAQPYGIDYDVFIDGKLVPKPGPRSPLVKYELPAGEHFITISAAGGGRKQFEVTVAGDQHVRKVWDFERNQWRR